MTLSLPIIDLGPWLSGDRTARAEVARSFDRAYREVGFLQVVNHGVNERTISGAFDAMNAFFTLEEGTKRRTVPTNPALYRGYSARLSESFSYSLAIERPPDLVEAFVIGADDVGGDPESNPFARNIWPDEPATFRSALWDYYQSARSLSQQLCRLAALALDVSDTFFDEALHASNTTLRCNWYYRQPKEHQLDDAQMALGAHTDYGILSVLAADPGPGLQVLDPAGTWQDVEPIPGAFIVNAGDALAVWTNDRWRSTVHRVLPSKTPGGKVRRSIALFQDGNVNTVMQCLPTCQSPENPPKYAPISLGQHVLSKIEGGRSSVIPEVQQTLGDRLVAE
jgi:isopenicillin N synthase-like dioxygenase